jgi:hypothetical protein
VSPKTGKKTIFDAFGVICFSLDVPFLFPYPFYLCFCLLLFYDAGVRKSEHTMQIKKNTPFLSAIKQDKPKIFSCFFILQKHEPDFFEPFSSYKNTNRIFLDFLHLTKIRTGFFWTFCIIQKHEPDFFGLSASYKNMNRIFSNLLHRTKTRTGFF